MFRQYSMDGQPCSKMLVKLLGESEPMMSETLYIVVAHCV